MRNCHSPSSERRQQFMDAAIELASQRGYEGATIKLIAEKCNVTVGTIYHYFKNKEDLFRQAVQERAFTSILATLLNDIDELPIEKGLFLVAQGFLKVIREAGMLVSIFISESVHNHEIGTIYADMISQNRQMMQAYLDKKIHTGQLGAIDTAVAVQIFFGHFFMAYFHKELLKMDNLPDIDETFVLNSVNLFLRSWQQEGTHV
ncbi:TetR/AcrR family transcriptional regulator [Heliophilum fasciatum]|uniref:TetR family transcriptional regulator n=1 Tax=Heliophilum fasciatum TaxID=35700 RepID=A0A4R2RC77_9FIRM|nr:TetR/AcrR family transcriptional regulator [Heliophilum fasciatum]MCW2279427.1 AcrR family transcriptional regulator [Heliophilum fasciatum]TCP59984.1 TetR family transcriptional regulator [Heliophilum fasciatum]